MRRVYFMSTGGGTNPPPDPGTPTLISRYVLDNGTVTDNVNSVHGTVVGTWTSTTATSLVTGINGTAFFKAGGSSHITLPANNAFHNLTDLTIHMYYQPSAATNKHTILACGFGNTAGHFAIERLTNGRIRGYHVGQDGGLRFFEGTNGVTGTNLATGVAYNIAISLGATGARLYINGTQVSTIVQNTNGWNNTAVKYIGIFVDATQSPLEGVVDYIRIWNSQLSASAIAALEPAITNELPSAQVGLSIIPFDTWLTNDDMAIPSTGTVRYAKPSGAGIGGTTEGAAGAIQATVTAMAPGDTTVLVPDSGTEAFFNLSSGLTFPSAGSNTSRYTIMAKPNTAAIIDMGQEFAQFRTANQSRWVLHSGNVWKSVATFTAPATVQRLWGVWYEFDIPHFMAHGYNSLAGLSASASLSGDPPTAYNTPGAILNTDGKVYIRMERPHPAKFSVGNRFSSDGRHLPTAPTSTHVNGQIQYPLSTDPNNYSIYLGRFNNASTNAPFISGGGVSGGNIVIGSGVNSFGGKLMLRAHNNVTVRRGLHLMWRDAFIVDAAINNIFFHRTRMTVGCGAHMTRDDFKFGGYMEPDRHAWIANPSNNPVQNLYCQDCSFLGWHELLVGGGYFQCRFKNCFFWHAVDEGLQTAANINRIELAYCFFLHAGFYGNGVPGSGGLTGVAEYYFHHNVVDGRTIMNYEDEKEPNGHNQGYSHSPSNPHPRKMYNNTLLLPPDVVRQRCGEHMGHNSGYFNTNTNTANEIFNNICVIQYDGRFTNSQPGVYVNAYNDQIVGRGSNNNAMNKATTVGATVNVRANDSNEFWDWNYYARHVPYGTGDSDFHCFLYNAKQVNNDPATAGGAANFFGCDTKAAWLASSFFTASKAAGTRRGAYTPGFDANSTFEQARYGVATLTLPLITVQHFADINWTTYPSGNRWKYRPTSDLPGISTSLSGANWWTTPPSWGATYFAWTGLQPSAWKGALDPNDDEITVGVLNP